MSTPELSSRLVAHLSRVAGGPVATERRYELLDEIGRGGMGIVYRALDLELEREVAVKRLHPGAGVDIETRLLREARIIGQLEHPGIVPIHDVGRSEDGSAFCVMRLVQGQSLRARMARGLDTDECIRIVDRLCDVLAFAHARGIVHRDVKPENVMIGPFGEILLLDWGVALAATSEERGVSGTHGFMPPEQAGGRSRHADGRVDVYALGALLDACAPMPRAPQLVAVIDRCRAASPGDRYQTVEALGADLRRLQAGCVVSAYQEGLLERLTRVAFRYRVAIALVSAYLVLRALLLLAAGI